MLPQTVMYTVNRWLADNLADQSEPAPALASTGIQVTPESNTLRYPILGRRGIPDPDTSEVSYTPDIIGYAGMEPEKYGSVANLVTSDVEVAGVGRFVVSTSLRFKPEKGVIANPAAWTEPEIMKLVDTVARSMTTALTMLPRFVSIARLRDVNSGNSIVLPYGPLTRYGDTDWHTHTS